MNLFFRMILIFIKASLRKVSVDVLGETTLKFRVWLTDQDMFAHMTNSRYMSFSDLGTINFIMRSSCWSEMRKRGWYPVICAQSMTVSRMLKFPQSFDVRTKLVGWNDTYVGISHTFERNGRTHAQVNVLARFASSDRTRVTPQDMIEAVRSTAQSPEIPRVFQQLMEEADSARAASQKNNPKNN